jgi:hypothetical protein
MQPAVAAPRSSLTSAHGEDRGGEDQDGGVCGTKKSQPAPPVEATGGALTIPRGAP